MDRSKRFIDWTSFSELESSPRKIQRTSYENRPSFTSSSSTMDIDCADVSLIPVTTFEDLCNEIFYEISDYLDAFDLFEAFTGLNQRYDDLIDRSSLPLKTSSLASQLHVKSIEDIRFVLQPKQHRLVSIDLDHRTLTELPIFFAPPIKSFTRLQHISLHEIPYHNLLLLFLDLSTLANLQSLDIHSYQQTYNLSTILETLILLPRLRYHRFVGKTFMPLHEASVPAPIKTDRSSSLEHLIIDVFCTFSELLRIIPMFPHLKRLKCQILAENTTSSDQIMTESFDIEKLTIHDSYMTFDVFEVNLTKICRSIRSLHLKTSWKINYLNANRWENLIRKRMPYLRSFSLQYTESIYENSIIQPEHLLLNQFSSKFWIDRQLMFELEIEVSAVFPFSSSYTVKSYRAMWYESIGVELNKLNRNIDVKSDEKAIGAYCRLHLILNDARINVTQQNTENFIHSILKPLPITDLRLEFYMFSMPILMEHLVLFPSLNSLSISSQIPENFKNLSEVYLHVIDQFAKDNRITKLNLERMTEIDQIHFLLHLCPKITHLQVTCRTMSDMEWLIQYISSQQAMKLIPELRCLSLCRLEADEQMVKTLHAIIQERQLFRNFSIHRICNQIFIHW